MLQNGGYAMVGGFKAGALARMSMVVAGVALLSAGADGAEAETVRLLVNHLSEPANVGPVPTFAWQMRSDRKGAAQSAYRLEVFEGGSSGKAVWDSGEVSGGRSVGVRYGGAALKPAHNYFWRVTVKDEKGAALEPATGWFATGLFGDGAWDGSAWISAVDAKVKEGYPFGRHDTSKPVNQEAADGTSCFVKTVPNGKAVKEAFWSVTGLGVFEAYVNGRPVSRVCRRTGGECRDFLKPGFTHFAKTKHSFTYDVTHLVKKGGADANVFAAQVTHGWWADKIVNFRGRKPAFRAQLVLRHEDGSETRVGTDESWLSGVAGPVLRAAIFDGEDYDARIGSEWMDGKSTAGFKASEINGEFKGGIFPMEGSPVRLRKDLELAPAEMYVWKGVEGAREGEAGTVRKIREYRAGDTMEITAGETLVVDFAQNSAAVPDFTASAAAGVTIKMRPSEMLNDGNGAKSRGCDGPEGSAYFTNYRRARTTLGYTFAGRGEESFSPEFTFFGFRYLTITADGPVKITRLRAVPVTSICKTTETGRISTGVADVNRLIKNVLWGQYSNYLSVPTDCPQRNERLGWTADTQVFAKAGSYNADTYGFLSKWMRDMRDTQAEDGSFTGVAPTAQYGDNLHQLGWADAGVIVPYAMWRQFGDTSIIDENWKSMEKYLSCVETMKYESQAATTHQWADWLSYEKLESCSRAAYEAGPDGKLRVRPDALTYWKYLGYCYWLWDARMMAEMAAATSRESAAARYRAMADGVLAQLRERFVDKADGMLVPLFRDMQTPALFALKIGLLEKPEAVAATKAALVRNIKDHGDCLQTGFLGTSILMETLSDEAGAPDVAYTLLLQHKNPSWLYSVDQGATTVWERWNSYTKKDGFGNAGMNSFNHYAYGAVLSWMYGTMAGIREDAKAGGYGHFTLAPVPDRRMGHVEASFLSPYGEIRSAWRYDGVRWTWSFTIPANSTATVTVPGSPAKEYAAGSYTVEADL